MASRAAAGGGDREQLDRVVRPDTEGVLVAEDDRVRGSGVDEAMVDPVLQAEGDRPQRALLVEELPVLSCTTGLVRLGASCDHVQNATSSLGHGRGSSKQSGGGNTCLAEQPCVS